MRLVVLGLSLSSAWGNGHATTWRALLRGFAGPGHDVLFLEREQPWYAAHRDLPAPDFCRLRFYDAVAGLDDYRSDLAAADAVLIGSFVPDGQAVIEQALAWAGGPVLFYDIDTPLTLAGVERGDCPFLSAAQIPRFAAYLSFTGGPTLQRLEQRFGARRALALYCCVDPDLYTPRAVLPRWDLSYLGTYSIDRQPGLDSLLLAPARANPQLRFVVAGSQYPRDMVWPDNVERIEHLPPQDHAGFYALSRYTLNLTRADMKAAGFSPSVRLFEAAACACPVLSDRWAGMAEVFEPGREILLVETAEDVLAQLAAPTSARAALASRAHGRALRDHTGTIRGKRLEELLLGAIAQAPALACPAAPG